LAGPRDHPRAPEQADQPPRSDDRPGRPDQPRAPDSPARVGRPDTPSPADREPRPDRPASAEDERRARALEALPPGHPSSPYQADGSRRPAEPSLRSLELPIPDEIAEEWGMVPSSQNKGASDRGNSGDWSSTWNEWDAGTSEPAGAEGRHSQDASGGDSRSNGRAHEVGGESGKPDDAAWSTSEPTRESGDGVVPAGRGKHGTADNTAGRSRDDNAQTADAVPPPEATHRYYWTEVPRFKSMWGAHESAWPKETQPAAKIDRSGDPPGSWRSDSNLLLSPEKHAQTREAIGSVQQTERSTTEHVHEVQQKNLYGGRLEGLDFRLKGEDRLKEKVAEILKREPERTPEEVVREVPDAVRYTFCIDTENYTDGYRDIRGRIEGLGHEMIYSKNFWDDPEYKGINTRWMTPDGHRFEVQFHTRESHHAKQEVTHEAYERIRNPQTSRAELTALHAFQREVSSWIPVPDDATKIPDYKKGM
jgi:hypothetical protein